MSRRLVTSRQLTILNPKYLQQSISNYFVFSGTLWSDKNFKFRQVQQNNWHIVLIFSLAYDCLPFWNGDSHLTTLRRPIWLRTRLT